MNILYIHQYFKTPNEPGGTRSYWVAQELKKHGHEVTILTANSTNKLGQMEKTVDGLKVIEISERYDQKMNIPRRMKAFFGFAWKSALVAKNQKNIDLIIATSTPLTVGITALLMKWFKKIPFIFEVRDLWPEVPIQMGAIKNPLIVSSSRYLEKTIYKNALHVIALSPGMLEGVHRYVNSKKTSMIPNMAKIDIFFPRKKNEELAKSLNLGTHTFKVIHFGSIGMANGTESIIKSANLIKNNNTIEFIFVGGGSLEQSIKIKCRELGLHNVKFLGKFSLKKTSEIVNLANISIVSFLDLPILYTNSPNKFFDSLSAGKPIVVNSAGWTKDIVEEYNCGFYVNPHNPDDLVNRILQLQKDTQLAQKMGENSRNLASRTFDKSILCKKYVKIIESVSIAELKE